MLLTIFLFIFNLILLYFFGEKLNRWSGFISIFLFFIYFLSQPVGSRKMLVFFISYLIGDFLLIFYENPDLRNIAFGFRAISFLVLAAMVFKRMQNLKLDFSGILVLVIACSVNFYLLHVLIDITPNTPGLDTFEFIFYAYGLSVILSVVASISYQMRYASKASFFFVVGVISLVLSKLSYYIGYYLEYNYFFLAFVFFEIIGLACLLNYLQKKPVESTSLI